MDFISNFLGMEKPNYEEKDWWLECPPMEVTNGANSKVETTVVFGSLGYPQEKPTTQFPISKSPTADCFFITPVFFNALHVTPTSSSKMTPKGTCEQTMLMAHTWASACKVYSPHYRQATATAVNLLRPQGWFEEAVEEGFQDIKASFDMYMKKWNNGRPIFIVGHDLGGRQALRLAKEYFDDNANLRKQLAGVYTTGFSLHPDKLPKNIKMCQGPGEVGTLAHWCCATEDAVYEETVCFYGDPKAGVGTNPMTWKSVATEEADGDRSLSDWKGALGMTFSGGYAVYVDCLKGAELKKGLVRVLEGKEEVLQYYRIGKGDYHIADTLLWYGNTRQNVKLQLEHM